ncbi:hypothetical protein CAEBREN_25053 [Caenorhabditis brenneri]|uniref:SPK domain-containing protein n=1 Tax=Caenorhabditis brenneri TaxID=135651 RepID=G0MMC8_CAEBE|nr:hypothetical protein CAEBREN_25053 [Caenorhabditis brenneri]
MVEEKRSIDKFMKWLVDERWDLSDPVPIRTLYTEFFENNGNEKQYERNTYNCIKAKLNGKNILEKFTIPQLAHIVFLLSIPVDKRMKKLVGNEEEEMPQVEEDDEAQRIQEALEEKFSRQHEIEVAEMSERNRIQDQMNDYAHNWNNFIEIEVRQEVSVASPQTAPAPAPRQQSTSTSTAPAHAHPSPQNAPAPRQQSKPTSTAPAHAQTTSPAINGAQFFKALKKVAYICELDNVLKEIEKNEAKVENQNLSIPIVDIIVPFTCILNDIKNLSGKNEQPSGPQITAELYLSSLNSAVLTLGSMEPLIKMIEKIRDPVRSKKMNISTKKIRDDFGTLLDVVGSSV